MDYPQNYYQQTQQQLPPGWVETIDSTSGRIYYANATTGESRWDVPSLINNTLPPPPPHLTTSQFTTTASQQQYQYPQQHQDYNINTCNYTSSSYGSSNVQNHWDTYSANDHSNATTQGYSNHATTGNTYNNYYGRTELQRSHQSEYQQPQQLWSTMPADYLQMSHQSNSAQNSHDIIEQNDVANGNHDTSKTQDITVHTTKTEEHTDPIHSELLLLSAGQIADQCFMQQQSQYEHNSNNSPAYSTPISIIHQSQRPRQEMGRLHTRYHTLREQLKQFEIFE